MFIRQLNYVVALAREQHFGRAAAACNVSQTALSGAIRSIEQELGIVIVQRGRRVQGFTRDGERGLAWARGGRGGRAGGWGGRGGRGRMTRLAFWAWAPSPLRCPWSRGLRKPACNAFPACGTRFTRYRRHRPCARSQTSSWIWG